MLFPEKKSETTPKTKKYRGMFSYQLEGHNCQTSATFT